MFGLYTYDIKFRNRKRHKRGLVISWSPLDARFKVSSKHCICKLLLKYKYYNCNIYEILHI